MKRSKRIWILLGVLAVACAITVAVSHYETQKEIIRNSDEVVLEISSDSVTALSWEREDQTLAFHRDETWLYDEDEAFPVDEEKINELLEQFQAFGVSFIIEEVEDYSQYGLDDPVCTIDLTTEEETYEILLGDYSTMDSQRYVSIGDGNVYLAAVDPMDYYDVELSDLIHHDDTPDFDQVESLSFSGSQSYEIDYQESGGNTYREEDVYFTQQNGEQAPLDTSRVESYLRTISYLDLNDYVTYNATEEELAACGLDNPELTIQVDYIQEDEEGNASSETFVLSVSRDPEELAAAQEETDAEAGDAEESSETEEEEEITAYARVGDSQILYQITGDDYTALMAAAYDDLRHTEILPAEFTDISRVEISLEGVDYTITTEGDEDERTYLYGEEELDIASFQSALEDLSADSFTDQEPTEKEEISLIVHLDLEGEPAVQISLYRYDGSYCLAVVDGEPLALVQRSLVVDLVEAVNAIVLGQ